MSRVIFSITLTCPLIYSPSNDNLTKINRIKSRMYIPFYTSLFGNSYLTKVSSNLKLFITSILFLVCQISTLIAQDCEEVQLLVEKYEVPPIVEAGTEFSLNQLISNYFGAVPRLISRIISPSKISTPRDQYFESMKNIEKLVFSEYETDKVPRTEIKKELENLMIAEEGIIVTSGFKPDSECYNALKKVSDNIVKLASSVGVRVNCQFYRFSGDLVRGTNCNKQKSGRVRATNTLNVRMKMWGSLQKSDGNWTSWEVYNVSPGKDGVWWACETNGNYIVLGVSEEDYKRYNCKKNISQQEAFEIESSIGDIK
jgi:hypothetical protein